MSDLTVLTLTALSSVSDFNLKSYALDHANTGNLTVGVAGYVGVAALLANTLQQRGVAYTNNMWNVGTSIVETAYAVWVQGEKLSNANLAGVALIIIGAYLLRLKAE